METCNSGFFFCKVKMIFITGMQYFIPLTPESEFLGKVLTINAHNNEEFTIKHCQKI